MKLIGKILLYPSVAFIAALIGLHILFEHSTLEIHGDPSHEWLEHLSMLGGYALFSLLVGIILQFKPKPLMLLLATQLAMIMSFVIFAGASILAFGDLCSLTNDKILFKHRTDKNRIIMLRSFGCGAVDSTPNVNSAYELKPITTWLNTAAYVDTHAIDHSQWERVSTKQRLTE